jgi:anaerobic selenocysteine-containing dehydrogenase
VDFLLRTGPAGDLFGLRRSGLSLAKVERHPHGIVLEDQIATGMLPKKVRHRDGRVHLDDPAIASELRRLAGLNGSPDEFPLKLIGMRELRSHNSWMHNAPMLLRGGRSHALRIHPEDAERAGLADGDRARVASEAGAVEIAVKVTDEMTTGTVALPHGWGHRGGWRLANRTDGVNVNLLAPSEPESLEPLAGMAHLNGIPVRVEPAASVARQPAQTEAMLA